MGPKLKRKNVKEKIPKEETQEKKRILSRESQRRKTKPIAGDEENKKRVSFGSSGTNREMPGKIPVEEDIKEECTNERDESTQKEEPQSELLPGPKGQLLYYDGIGYYYTQLREDATYRWLQCSHAECKVMAQMRRWGGSLINVIKGAKHDHPPNPERRDRILFLHTVKTRHAKEDTPFSLIFQQEACKNPVGASFFSFDKIQAHLQKKISQGDSENLSQESVLNAASKLSIVTKSRPSLDVEPAVKKRRTDDDLPPSGIFSKKLEVLKSLKDVSFTEFESSEPTSQQLSKPSERLPGPHPHSYIYHDGHGYFYKPLSISGNTRYLHCNSVGCNAQAVMALDENAPISLKTDSPAHNHLPKAQTPKSSSILPGIQKTSLNGDPKKVNKTIQTETQVANGVGLLSQEGLKNENKKIGVETENQESISKMQEVKVVLNKIPASPMRRHSVRIEGPEYYYDFKGHYYFTTQTYKERRYLRCLFPTCLAQAFMNMDEDAEIQPLSGSRPHNHQPDFTSKYHTKIKQWEEQWADCQPSERLPSLRVQYCCYHDGRGFYYHQTSQADNIRYLVCAESGCPVKAHMCTQKDAPITISSLRMGHCHGPDHSLRDALLFIDAVRVRVRSNTAPATAIALESARNPVGAGRVKLAALQLCLEQVLEIANNKSKDGIVEDEVDFMTCLRPQKKVPLKPSTVSQIPVSNHFSSPRPNLDDQSKNEEESDGDVRKVESEMVPALLSDSWLYHDGSGFYYDIISVNQGYRHLQCMMPKCGAQAWVKETGGPIKLQKPHSHGPQPPRYRVELWFFHRIKTQAQINPEKPLAQVYWEIAMKGPEGAAVMSEAEVLKLMDTFLTSTNENGYSAQNRISVSPSSDPTTVEKLPNTTFGRRQYHDGQGYYYTIEKAVKKNNSILLKCISRAACPAKATLVDGMVKINWKSRHNHNPDLIHRDICLFSHTLKKRARDEDTPVSVIYEEEARNYPEAAAVLREDRLKEKLTSIRRYIRREFNIQDEEEEFGDSVSCINQVKSPSLASELFLGFGNHKDVYHDGRGYYYNMTFISDQLRYLMCCEPHCLAQAKMGLNLGAPVVRQVGSPRHCHPPDPLRRHCLQLLDNVRRRAAQRNVKVETILQEETAKEPVVAAQIPTQFLFSLMRDVRFSYLNKKGSAPAQTENEREGLWALSTPCERIPSDHGWVYYDSGGYYYYCHDINKSRTRSMLKCCEEGCDATVWLDDLRVTRAPGSVMHNHTPEPRRRSMLLLLHRVATRAQLEHTNVAKIYEEEAGRNPEGASLIPKNKLNETLHSLTVSKYFKELEEEELTEQEGNSDNILNMNEKSVMPCEQLYSASLGKLVYSDNAGHYFTELQKTTDRLYVKCLMPLCEARAYLVLNDPWNLHIPMSQAEHNHNPDLLYRSKLVFIHNVRARVTSENTAVDVIYSEESEREPLGADLVSEVSVKNLMYKLRKSKSLQDGVEEFIFEDVSDDLSGHVQGGVVEKVHEPPAKSQEEDEQVSKDTRHNEEKINQNNKNASFLLKKEVPEEAEEGDDEYTEEEYLEEERLEEEEDDPQVSTGGTPKKTEEVLLPSEKLPLRSHTAIYHDGKGYYFLSNAVRGNVMYMRCTDLKCKVRASRAADKDDAPIIVSKKGMVHNHRPDFIRRKQLLFIHHCKMRAAKEINLTVNEIWEAEAARDPETASLFAAGNVKAQMTRYRLEQAANSDIQSTGIRGTQEPITEDGITFQDASVTDPVLKNEPEIDIHLGAVPEKVPSLPGDLLWYAAGYFYSTSNTTAFVEKVKCVEKACVAQAQVTLGDRSQPLDIRLNKNTVHCHPPDLQRRNLLMFIDRCKKRAATTLQSIEEIYYDEAAKAPEVAKQLSAVRVKRAMGVAKKEKMKKGVRLESKESEDSGASGDHGMSELGEMASVTPTSAQSHSEEVEGGASGDCAEEDSDYYCTEDQLDDADDLWTVDPKSLSGEEKIKRKKALARERQRRRRSRMIEDPDKWEQLERDREKTRQRALAWQKQKKIKLMVEEKKNQPDSFIEPKTVPKLGPRFLKELGKTVNEEEYEEPDELLDQTYSDYVTLEEELDFLGKDLKNEKENEAGTSNSVSKIQGAPELVGHTVL